MTCAVRRGLIRQQYQRVPLNTTIGLVLGIRVQSENRDAASLSVVETVKVITVMRKEAHGRPDGRTSAGGISHGGPKMPFPHTLKKMRGRLSIRHYRDHNG